LLNRLVTVGEYLFLYFLWGGMMEQTGWTRREFATVAAIAGVAAASSRWMRGQSHSQGQEDGDVTAANSLRAHAEARGLLYGAAVVPQLLNTDGGSNNSSADAYAQLVKTQTNMLVAENAMKWGALRPSPGVFDFTQADKLMRFAALAGQKVRGHNLCWHEGNPGWLKTTANKDNARALLVEHIETVAAHFRGQLHSWDVVNEAIEPKDAQPDGLRKTLWYDLLGPEYLELAYRTAGEVDPAAKLTYNDYSIELDTPEQTEKRDQVLALVRRFKAKGVPIHAVGLQSHLQADGPQPGEGLVKFIRELGRMGLEVYITEMDVNTRKIEGGAAEQDAAVAKVYRDYPALVLAEPNVKAVLTWGITDAHTWLNSRQPWAQRPDGTKQRPLPFDEDLKPTAAFFALRGALDGAPSRKA
jgi:endo-1,4-beta-xylanase